MAMKYKIIKNILDLPKSFIVFLIKGYRYIVSPFLPRSCRFYPSCSVYALQALKIHGFLKGGRLMVLRVLRCHPMNQGGVDLVPLKTNKKASNR